MLIRRTDNGHVERVSNDKAFAMMDAGEAIKDKGFMAMYGRPEKSFEAARADAKKKKAKAKSGKKTKENARSKNAAAAEKAVAEN